MPAHAAQAFLFQSLCMVGSAYDVSNLVRPTISCRVALKKSGRRGIHAACRIPFTRTTTQDIKSLSESDPRSRRNEARKFFREPNKKGKFGKKEFPPYKRILPANKWWFAKYAVLYRRVWKCDLSVSSSRANQRIVANATEGDRQIRSRLVAYTVVSSI